MPATCTGTEPPPICSGITSPTPPASSASRGVTSTGGGASSVGCAARSPDVRWSVSGTRTLTPFDVALNDRPADSDPVAEPDRERSREPGRREEGDTRVGAALDEPRRRNHLDSRQERAGCDACA